MKQILVVDNNPMVLSFMKDILSSAGYSVLTADNGLGAFDILKETSPDFIIVDLVMPEIDGKQLLSVINKKDRFRGVKKIILSAVAAENKELDFAHLADACIAKMPFKKMKTAVLEVLRDMEAGNTEKYRGLIVGAEELYSREITEELLITKHHQEILISSITDGFMELTQEYRILYTNPAACRLIGLSDEKLLSADFLSLFEDGSQNIIRKMIDSLGQEPKEIGEHEKIIIGGRRILLRFIPVTFSDKYSILAILQDITLRKQAEDTIRISLEQKENQLREIHHRVNTNLQIISSLLNLQSQKIPDAAIEQYFTRSQSRIEAMALVHEQLQDSSDLLGIDLDTYLRDLVSQIIHTYAGYNKPIRSTISVPEILISIEAAVPLGLIVNELITNALIHGIKYLDEAEKEGKINLTISESENGYTLKVNDNGPGIPADFDISSSGSLGLSLVSSLAGQLRGRLIFPFDAETKLAVEFNL